MWAISKCVSSWASGVKDIHELPQQTCVHLFVKFPPGTKYPVNAFAVDGGSRTTFNQGTGWLGSGPQLLMLATDHANPPAVIDTHTPDSKGCTGMAARITMQFGYKAPPIPLLVTRTLCNAMAVVAASIFYEQTREESPRGIGEWALNKYEAALYVHSKPLARFLAARDEHVREKRKRSRRETQAGVRKGNDEPLQLDWRPVTSSATATRKPERETIDDTSAASTLALMKLRKKKRKRGEDSDSSFEEDDENSSDAIFMKSAKTRRRKKKEEKQKPKKRGAAGHGGKRKKLEPASSTTKKCLGVRVVSGDVW